MKRLNNGKLYKKEGPPPYKVPCQDTIDNLLYLAHQPLWPERNGEQTNILRLCVRVYRGRKVRDSTNDIL